MHAPNPRGPRAARGFTLVELLVVITIIGMLMALLIPAIGSATETARQEQCKSNIRQIGQALISYQASRQRLPGYLQPLQRSDNSFLRINADAGLALSTFGAENSTRDQSQVSWAAIILPQLEQQPIYDTMIDDKVSAPIGGDFNDVPIAQIRPLDVYRCPSDSGLSSSPDNAGLSYSVNAGAPDFNGSGVFIQPGANDDQPGDIKANGLFFNLGRLNRPITHTIDSIRDGSTQTIMLAENVHKESEDFNPSTRPGWCWMGVDGGRIGEPVFGINWTPSTQPNNEMRSDTAVFQQPISFEDSTTAPPFPTTTPEYARPASEHAAGVFNVYFADGHAASISADVDYLVYQQLLTARGRRCEDPLETFNDSTNMPEAINTFRTQPALSPEDF